LIFAFAPNSDWGDVPYGGGVFGVSIKIKNGAMYNSVYIFSFSPIDLSKMNVRQVIVLIFSV
jgi:hypothetical protein